MTKSPEYRHFVSYCRRYKTAKQILKEKRLDPMSLIDTEIKRKLTEEVKVVDDVFEQLKQRDEKLAEIMYLKLIEKQPLRKIELNSSVDMSKRQIITKYPERNWERYYNELFG